MDPTQGRELSCRGAWPAWEVTFVLISRRFLTRSSFRCVASDRNILRSSVSASLPGRLAVLQRRAKVRNSNSLAFVDGVPIFERFFLGDEFTIRGYNVRSITPLAPLDTYITSRNVVVASNASGTPVPIPGVPASWLTLAPLPASTGKNVVQLPRSFTPIGADTQVLGNFEYRIPVIGSTVSLAASQTSAPPSICEEERSVLHSNFLDDQPFLDSVGLIRVPEPRRRSLSPRVFRRWRLQRQHDLALAFSGSGLGDARQSPGDDPELDNARNLGPFDPSPVCLLVSGRYFCAVRRRPTPPFAYRKACSRSLEIIAPVWAWRFGCRCRSSTCLFA